MNKSNSTWNKVLVGFSIVVILSGIYLICQKDIISGVCGIAVGLLLLFLNTSKENQDQNNISS